MIKGTGRELVLAAIRAAAGPHGDCLAWCDKPDEGNAVLMAVPPQPLLDAETRGYVRVVSRETPVVEMHSHANGLCSGAMYWRGAVIRVTEAGKREARDEFVDAN